MRKLSEQFQQHITILSQRFDAAMEATGIHAVVIPSGEPRTQFLDDMDYPFKVNPHFKTWVPLTENPHCWLVYRRGSKPQVFFHQAHDFWHKPAAIPTQFWVEHFDLEIHHDAGEVLGALPGNSPAHAILGEWHELYQGRLDQMMLNPETLLNQLHFGRTLKSAYELSCLRSANDLAVRGHLEAAAAFNAGKSELAIHLAYLNAAEHLEHEVPYGNIVALNQNAAVLHYQHCAAQTPNPVHSFLIDAGANCRGYAADITRTYAACAGEFAEMIDAFEQLQQDLVGALKPGLSYIELHRRAHRDIAAWLQRFGLIQCTAEDAVESGVTRTFFPHGLGHFIGLQVHDVAGKQANAAGEPLPAVAEHPFLRLLHTLQPGHCLTIEPGIYFIPSLLQSLRDGVNSGLVNWSKVEALLPYGGIRIEDDIHITTDGFENITRDAFARA